MWKKQRLLLLAVPNLISNVPLHIMKMKNIFFNQYYSLKNIFISKNDAESKIYVICLK